MVISDVGREYAGGNEIILDSKIAENNIVRINLLICPITKISLIFCILKHAKEIKISHQLCKYEEIKI